MEDFLRFVFSFIIWTFVPAILVFAFLFSARLHKRVEDKKYKAAIRSGFWAGIMLFIIGVIYQVSQFIQTGFPSYDLFQGFNVLITIGSAILSFVFVSGGKRFLPLKASGFIVLLLTFVSSYGLFNYFFVRAYNEYLLSAILGISLGLFAHFAASPSVMKDSFQGGWK